MPALEQLTERNAALRRELEALAEERLVLQQEFSAAVDLAVLSLPRAVDAIGTSDSCDSGCDVAPFIPELCREATAMRYPTRFAQPPPSFDHFATAVQRKANRTRSLPLDQHGRLQLPVVLGRAASRVSIYSMGAVSESSAQPHTPSCIYPTGFLSKRKFVSWEPGIAKRVLYTCRIESTDDGRTFWFAIQLRSDPRLQLVSAGMAQLWQRFCERFPVLPPEMAQFTCGEDFFGLSHVAVRHWLQELPGAHLCASYVPLDGRLRTPATKGGAAASALATDEATSEQTESE